MVPPSEEPPGEEPSEVGEADVPPDELPAFVPEPPLDLAAEPEDPADSIELIFADFDAELVPFEKPASRVLPDPEELDL